MSTSTDRDEGTTNSERISSEVQRAAQDVEERFPGYRTLLTNAAIECFLLTAEHDEQRININQKYEHVINELARQIGQSAADGSDE
ncbi:hypothetical protein [Streptomyces sp. NPDC056464]|uniref:hypothetical protein n=1 Tax=Streptomyces sp. NPDC056464 TaxID=3345828 RepID=UPI003692CFCF